MGEGKDDAASLAGTRKLADAVRAAKIAAAYRSDVVVDIREADRARLEIFVETFQPIIDEVSPSDDLFDFTLSAGPQPRFWVDGTAHVMMARDRRTYRFVRETRLGRILLAESTEPRLMVDRVTDYVAERMVERDKAFAETDSYGRRVSPPASMATAGEGEPMHEAPVAAPARPSVFASALAWLLIGAVLGAGILFAVASYRGFSMN